MKKILVVNNDLETMSLLQSLLQRKNYEVSYTGNTTEIVNITKKFDPQLLLIDKLQVESITNLKADTSTKNIPIILMTGYTLPKEKNMMPLVEDVIEKPFDLADLQKKIEKLV